MHQSKPEIIIKIAKEQRDKALAILQEKKYIDIIAWYISTGNLLGELLGQDNTYTKGFRAAKIPNENIKDISETERELTVVASFGITALNALIDDFEVKIKHHIVSTPVPSIKAEQIIDNRKIFIVHGHDSKIKDEVTEYLLSLGLNPIVLQDQPNLGKTIIEKLEYYVNQTSFAIIIFTKDDFGVSKIDFNMNTIKQGIEYMNSHGLIAEVRGDLRNLINGDIDYSIIVGITDLAEEMVKHIKPRARQNVIFELGITFGILHRTNVRVIYEEGVEIPTDILGYAYTALDDKWKQNLEKELKAVHIL